MLKILSLTFIEAMEKESEEMRLPRETTEWQTWRRASLKSISGLFSTFSNFFSFSFVQDSGLKTLSKIWKEQKHKGFHLIKLSKYMLCINPKI